MELSSVLHIADRRFAYALNEKEFVIRIRTKKDDLKEVILHSMYKYVNPKYMDTRKQTKMTLYAKDNVFDYYEANIEIDCVCLRYYFELVDNDSNKAYFGNNRFYKKEIENIDFMFDLPQNLREEERYVLPKWAKNGIVYQIFPARFASSEEISKEIWYKEPIGHFDEIGGNLRGIINKLDHIKELGTDLIYMTPIFKSTSSHKYNIADYYTIDPKFGSKDDLKELVAKAHELGIRVVLDGVFNHTGTDFFAFEDVKKNGKNSKYWNWYYIEDYPVVAEWGKKPNYKTFIGLKNVILMVGDLMLLMRYLMSFGRNLEKQLRKLNLMP